jgi:DNA-binding NarL/FixJ family response regulator
VYRLREKITYHAIRVFAFKQQPDLVGVWLGTTLSEHRLGLTQTQWEQFWHECSPLQQQILEQLRAGLPIEAIAKKLGLRANQIMSEWSKLYLAAQTLRTTQ